MEIAENAGRVAVTSRVVGASTPTASHGADSEGGSRRFTLVLFGTMLLFAVLPSAPILGDVNRISPVPLQAPLALLWLLLEKRHGRVDGRASALVGLIVVSGILTTMLAAENTNAIRTLVGTVFIPVIVFFGLQGVDGFRREQLYRVTAVVLAASAGFQVVNFISVSGLAGLTSAAFVFSRHTDLAFWAEVGGDVLGNPNNASVVYCTGLGVALRNLVLRNGRRSMAFLFIAMTLAGIWVTGSRGAYLTALGLLLWSTLGRRLSGKRLIALLACSGVVLYLVNLWRTRFDQTDSAAQSLETRVGTRWAAVRTLVNDPVGAGAGNTPDAMVEELKAVDFGGSATTGATAHDVFLNFGVALGVLGLTCLLLLLGISLLQVVRREGWAGCVPLVAFIASAEAAGIDVLNSTNPAWAMVLWTIIGLAVTGNQKTATLQGQGKRRSQGELHRQSHRPAVR